MNSQSRKTIVRRITVDEKLSDDLFRFLICPLKKDVEKFHDESDYWQGEGVKLVNPKNYAKILGVNEPEAPKWEELKEGQVYLSGEFDRVNGKTEPILFRVSRGRRKFLRIDNLEAFDEDLRSLYSDALKGG